MSAPTSYRPAFAEIARSLASNGARNKDVAAALGVHPKTVQAWKRRHGDLAAALDEGRSQRRRSGQEVGLYARAVGHDRASERVVVEGAALVRRPAIDHVPPSDRAITTWLVGRRPDRWRRPPRAASARHRARGRQMPGREGRDATTAAEPATPPSPPPIAPGLSRYDPRFDAEAETLAAAGALDRDLAFVFGVHRGTLRQWRKRHPSFAAAVARGKAVADDRVEQALFRRATGYDWIAPASAPADAVHVRHVRPSESAAIFWLANRRPDRWRGEREAVPLPDAPEPPPPIDSPFRAGVDGIGNVTTPVRPEEPLSPSTPPVAALRTGFGFAEVEMASRRGLSPSRRAFAGLSPSSGRTENGFGIAPVHAAARGSPSASAPLSVPPAVAPRG